MNDLVTRAQLVDYDPASAAIGAIIPRAEFAETAARGEFPATLLLDLDRVETGDGDGSTQARVALDWDKDTLDQLLASTEGEEIALWFDQRELAVAFEDVEAHGIRERAAILAVAVTAAGVSATPALARLAPVPTGAERGAQLNQQISAGPTTSTQGAAVRAMGAERGAQLNQQLSAGPTTSTQDAAVRTTGAQRGEQVTQQISLGQTQSTGSESTAVTSTAGSGLSSSELAAIVGAGAILISAAGFGIARKQSPPVRPA